MKLKNLWFDFTSFLCFLFMLGCAFVSIREYLRGEGGNTPAVLSIIAFFLVFAFVYFRMSLLLGKLQKKQHERKPIPDEIRKRIKKYR
jgi:hypothetical protein